TAAPARERAQLCAGGLLHGLRGFEGARERGGGGGGRRRRPPRRGLQLGRRQPPAVGHRIAAGLAALAHSPARQLGAASEGGGRLPRPSALAASIPRPRRAGGGADAPGELPRWSGAGGGVTGGGRGGGCAGEELPGAERFPSGRVPSAAGRDGDRRAPEDVG
ncbi:unnamed protein product, partial [Ectocarpus sp. 12 AP-2014]